MRSQSSRGQNQSLRIIGGEWRGRKLNFPEATGLRPTADRVRETLFNWVAPRLTGARCLDLFAGSGALGLEALSRGAAHCDFVDNALCATQAISNHLITLSAQERGSCHTTNALSFLETADPYDIIFIDPPFAASLAPTVLTAILDRRVLATQGRIYFEVAKEDSSAIDQRCTVLRDKFAGEVHFRLLGIETVNAAAFVDRA